MTAQIIFGILVLAMFLIEKKYSRRTYKEIKGWYFRSIIFTFIQIFTVFLIHSFLDEFFERHRFYNIDNFGEIEATLLAFLVMTFISYWQHRLKHQIPFLWKYLHQIHHSPNRIELLTSFYRNPLEIVLNMIIMSATLLLGVGVNLKIAMNVVLLMGFADMFYHWNVKTPYWIGFIIQRPESHGIHHLRNVHAYNYGDLVIWDMIFGTFKNIRNFHGICGFDNEKEREVIAMLKGQDFSGGTYYHKLPIPIKK
jgi:sterol desaturase/sphingolipid hydroxylase (fatty acid hydroxylase superfamily)